MGVAALGGGWLTAYASQFEPAVFIAVFLGLLSTYVVGGAVLGLVRREQD